jgi:predicted RNase H-like HicB family nuclease
MTDFLSKDLMHYMSLRYPIVLEQEEDGSWGAYCPDLLGCAGAGETIDECLAMLEDAKRGWFTSRLAHGHPIPEPHSVALV